ncbi:transposase [Alicyclobacillus fodiniaquatilis]|uniref:transposase n=1 Tax=Alicyclobacillus fodiniaquatilis TaxID=1661150 RepID=UPI003A8FF9AC
MEYSSGSSRWQGGITKAGNSHLRRILGEAAWISTQTRCEESYKEASRRSECTVNGSTNGYDADYGLGVPAYSINV